MYLPAFFSILMAADDGGGAGGDAGGEGGGDQGGGFFDAGSGGEGGEGGGDVGGNGDQGGGDAGGEGGGDSGGAKDLTWMQGLPDNLKNERILHDFGNANEALSGYVSLFQKMGAGPDKLLRLPADDAPDADYADIYKRLGRPTEAEGYTVPQGIEVGDDAFLTTLKQGAHAAGLSGKQFTAIVKTLEGAENGWSERQAAGVATANAEAKKAASTELQIHFGKEFPENNALIGRVFHGLSESLRADLESTGLAYHPELLKAFADLGRARREDGSRGGGALGVSDAMGELKRLGLDPEFQKALGNSDHAEHKNALARKQELYEMAYPNELTGPGYGG